MEKITKYIPNYILDSFYIKQTNLYAALKIIVGEKNVSNQRGKGKKINNYIFTNIVRFHCTE